TALRLIVALAAFVIFYIVSGRRSVRWDPRLWASALSLGVLGTALPMLGIISALQQISSGVVAIIATCGPAFAVVFAHWWLPDERITPRRLLGLSITMLGAVLLATRNETGLTDVGRGVSSAYLVLVVSLLGSHASIVLSRRYLSKYDMFDVVSLQMLAAAVVLAPIALTHLDVGRVSNPGLAWFSVLFGGIVGTFLAFSSRFRIIKDFGATDAATIDYLVPLIAVAFGALFARERVTPVILSSMLLILSGIRMIRVPVRRGAPQSVAALKPDEALRRQV
ncbi:MAG TPA: DMT family transporter, partial [Polyangiaceae bacterium]|nr:DMT family transporter [Polyangiaceae bacterium]